MDAQGTLQRTSTLPGELDQIREYVDATNTHIHQLETIAEDSTRDHIVDIKRGLKDAHTGLERLEERFAVIGELRRQVWQTYRRLREFEEKMDKGEDISLRELNRPKARAIRTVPTIRTASVTDPSALGVASRAGEGVKPQREVWWTDTPRVAEEEERYLTPNTLQTLRSITPRSRTPGSSGEDEGQEAVVGPPRLVPVAIPARAHTVGESHRRTRRVEDKWKRRSEPPTRPQASTSQDAGAGRREVIARIADEERKGGVGINDPHRRREGSSDGWHVTQAVMTASVDTRLCVPHLAYVKIHEVRDLKRWLSSHRYVRGSRRLSRMEKVLHLLTLLQVGCRFESVAVLFSRTPQEVLAACKEVFEGILEMHSETMLPRRSVSKRYVYPHLWRIVRNYAADEDEAGGQASYVWEKEDVDKVLITLNIYIGRYRSQGHFALDGDYLDWGRYIQADDKRYLTVPSLIERLQSAPRTEAT